MQKLLVILVLLAMVLPVVALDDSKDIESYANGVLAGSPGVSEGHATVYYRQSPTGNFSVRVLGLQSTFSPLGHSVEEAGSTIWFLSQAGQKILDKYPEFDDLSLVVVYQDKMVASANIGVKLLE